jgi:hypothetical protein
MNNASKGRSLPFPPPALTLALGVIRLADGHGPIGNSTWRRSRALLEHSAAGPLIREQPTIMRVFAASPSAATGAAPD